MACVLTCGIRSRPKVLIGDFLQHAIVISIKEMKSYLILSQGATGASNEATHYSNHCHERCL